MHVVILESLGISQEEMAKLRRPFEEKGVTFTEYPRTADPAKMAEEARDADALILANMPLPGEVIAACPKLRFIDVAFTGVDHIDLAAARERGIVVSNASGYSNEAVAELTLGTVLALARNLRAVEDRCRAGGDKSGLVGWELRGKTVGIIGYGRIGRRSGELFRSFGCNILANTRGHHDDLPLYAKQVTREELLRRSDIVALHCPLDDTTRGMIGRRELAMMKPSAILVNMARGPVVVAEDLAQALDDGIIAGAAVDVFDREPPLPPDNPLLSCRNCLVTPHVAFATRESMTIRAETVFQNLEMFLEGSPVNRVI